MLPRAFRLSLIDPVAADATALEIPSRRMWPIGLMFGAMFAIFAGVEWFTISQLFDHSVRDIFDLMFFLFQAFWVLGWSVGVVILGALTTLLCFYQESARLQDGRLMYVPHLGPLHVIMEYDLDKVSNLRVVEVGDKGRVTFDYNKLTSTLGDTMARSEAASLVDTIRRAAAGTSRIAPRWEPDVEPVPAARPPESVERPKSEVPVDEPADLAPPSLTSLSGLALVGANLLPLAGVLFFGWNLSNVLVLYWAESAVIGFYTALKMIVVGRWMAIVAVPFFVGHFGGFMAGHFLLIYGMFVRGIGAAGKAPGVWPALYDIFVPLWTSLFGLVVSHGVSFYSNFLQRREYASQTIEGLMKAPYNRIVIMQLTLIFGGWIVLLLRNPVPALAVLILLKTAADFLGHAREHGPRTYFAPGTSGSR
jgi:hypothetical protein